MVARPLVYTDDGGLGRKFHIRAYILIVQVGPCLGFGRIVVSEKEAPSLLANLM
jgi:hypothetical protein